MLIRIKDTILNKNEILYIEIGIQKTMENIDIIYFPIRIKFKSHEVITIICNTQKEQKEALDLILMENK